MKSAVDKNTSVFPNGDISRAETQRRREGGSCFCATSIDRSNWKRVRLGEVLQVCHGKCQHAIESKTGKYPILATSGEIGRTDSYLYDKPSVLIGRKGTIDKPQYVDTPFWTIDTLFYTKVTEGFSAKFMFYLCQTIDWSSLNEASGVPSLSANRIETLEVYLPNNIDEQLRIAESLDAVETHTNTLQSLISKYEAIKKATVNLLLKPKKGWRAVRLGEVCNITTGRKDVNQGNQNGRYPFFTCSHQVCRSDTYSFCDEAILIAGNGDVGSLHYYKGKFEAYQRTYVLTGFTIDARYCLQYLSCNLMHTLNSEKIGSTIPYIVLPQLTKFPLCMPQRLSEQREIAEQIAAIDNVLDDFRKRLAKAQNLKQGMMSYFFG